MITGNKEMTSRIITVQKDLDNFKMDCENDLEKVDDNFKQADIFNQQFEINFEKFKLEMQDNYENLLRKFEKELNACKEAKILELRQNLSQIKEKNDDSYSNSRSSKNSRLSKDKKSYSKSGKDSDGYSSHNSLYEKQSHKSSRRDSKSSRDSLSRQLREQNAQNSKNSSNKENKKSDDSLSNLEI